MVPSLPLLSCESSVSMEENPDRKKNDNNNGRQETMIGSGTAHDNVSMF